MAYSIETWRKMRIEYESIGTSVAALSKKYKIATSTIDIKIKKDRWIKYKVVKDAKIMAAVEAKLNQTKADVIAYARNEGINANSKAFAEAHAEEHRQISVRNQAEAVAAETRLKLALQNRILTDTLDVHNDVFAVQKHNTLVSANKNVDTSRQSNNNVNVQQNNQQNNNNIFADIAAQHKTIYDDIEYDA